MNNANSKNVLLLCLAFLASALMLTVIQPPISASGGEFRISNFEFRIFPLLAWVSLVPFILACSPNTKPLSAARLADKPLALIAYTVSLCYWLGNLYWVAPITIVGWITFCLYTALFWPILALSIRYCMSKKIPLFLAAGVLFVGAERLQGLFLGGFFWRFLAHSQYQNITLIQTADIFGTAGLSFLIAMVNGLLAELILDSRSWKGIFKISNLVKIAIVSSAVVAAVIYGQWRINQSPQFITQGPVVASLQSNVPQSVKRSFAESDGIFDELMQKSKAAAKAGAELIVWPETMVQAVLNERVLAILDPSHSYIIFDKALREHSKDTAYVLVGAYGGMPQIREDSTIHLAKKYNSAFLYKSDGQQSDKYYSKIHLVPFGEFLPFKRKLPLLYNLLMKFTPYNYDYSLDAGSEYTVFEMTSRCHSERSEESIPAPQPQPTTSPRQAEIQDRKKETRFYRFSVIICYEDTVPAITRRFALDRQGRKQIDWLVNISNDGWFVRFKDGKVLPDTELPQHAAICVFRAVENRLPVLRSVNTGISCLIDSMGRIRDGYTAASPDFPPKAMQRQGLAGWFVDEMPIDKRVTFFSKYGQCLDFCCAICLVLLIIVPLSEKIFRSQKYITRLSGKVNEKHAQKK